MTTPPPTPNYALNKASENDRMANFETWLNANWDKLTDAVSPNSGTTLPQAGDYEIGDRFYKSDTKSIYLLSVKDANWGWHWRPIQDAISPWLTIPTTCMNIDGWTLNPVAANPFQIALDNRGKCYWRGIIGTVESLFIVRNVSHAVFKPLPAGIRPRERGVYFLGHSPLSVGTSGTNFNSFQGARLYVSDEIEGTSSVRTIGGTADPNRIHLTGINYAVGTARYTVA